MLKGMLHPFISARLFQNLLFTPFLGFFGVYEVLELLLEVHDQHGVQAVYQSQAKVEPDIQDIVIR